MESGHHFIGLDEVVNTQKEMMEVQRRMLLIIFLMFGRTEFLHAQCLAMHSMIAALLLFI